MSTKLYIYGTVQGVGFRPTVYRIAKSLGYRGYVRNNGSHVEVFLNKDPKEFVRMLEQELPPLARIDYIKYQEAAPLPDLDGFTILHSASEHAARDAAIPPDTALCDECIKELFDKQNRRYLYPFTNCTNCGARFSLINDMPYDRPNTAMGEFKLCSVCKDEYTHPLDRRFHAQTISCAKDGPHYKLYDSAGNSLECADPISVFAKYIDNGHIGVVKSWGGMHIVCTLPEIKQLRRRYRSSCKPFAVMVRDLRAANRYAVLDNHAEELLYSPQRPIVVVPKNIEAGEELEDAAPGLDSIGIYLPYSGIQYLLFHYLKHDALVMTSANPPGEPMCIDAEEVFKLNLDFYLLHNRRIINRIDDSVVIPYKGNTFFIRRSRGYIPQSLQIWYDSNIVCMGAERNVAASISTHSNLYTTQYIGNTSHYYTLQFLDSATRYLMRLLELNKINAVGIDLHPQYATRKVGTALAHEFDAELIEIQHHWAHAASLMLDNNIPPEESIVALTLDGTGYGTDGKIWGGEVLHAHYGTFKRLASLEEIPLLGGDMAIKEPKRVVFALYETLGETTNLYDDATAEVFRKMMKHSPWTSSMGRVLDALAYCLGVCTKRTYDGEPAMRLERYLLRGAPIYEFITEIIDSDRKIIRTSPLFATLREYIHHPRTSSSIQLTERQKADIAYSFVKCLMDALTAIAVEHAEAKGIEYVGLTGGVAYNIPITAMVTEYVERNSNGLKLLLHNSIPNGDGGISAGQNVAIGSMNGS